MPKPVAQLHAAQAVVLHQNQIVCAEVGDIGDIFPHPQLLGYHGLFQRRQVHYWAEIFGKSYMLLLRERLFRKDQNTVFPESLLDIFDLAGLQVILIDIANFCDEIVLNGANSDGNGDFSSNGRSFCCDPNAILVQGKRPSSPLLTEECATLGFKESDGTHFPSLRCSLVLPPTT